MDMKRILQAMDGVATKPVVGVNDMKKFLQAVTEANLNQPTPGGAADPKDQAETYVRYSSGFYDINTLPKTIVIRPGLTLPLVQPKPINPKTVAASSLANARQANNRLPADLKFSDSELEVIVGINDAPSDADMTAWGNISEESEPLNEGTNPHKVALPVQMAMQHYQEVAKVTTTPITEKKSSIKTFFKEVQLESEEEDLAKRQIRNQYAQRIAERVLMKENQLPKGSHLPRLGPTVGPGMGNYVVDETPIAMDPSDANNPLVHGHEKANPMHLKDRIMQARAQLRELAQLAESNDLIVWERITRLAKGGMFMGLEQNLEQIRHGINELAKKRKQGGVASRGIDKHIGEGFGDFPNTKQPKTPLAKPKTIKSKSKTSSCRAGQTQVGMQNKDGKMVPKCAVKLKK